MQDTENDNKCSECYLFHRVDYMGFGICYYIGKNYFSEVFDGDVMHPIVKHEGDFCSETLRRFNLEIKDRELTIKKLKDDRKLELDELESGLILFRKAKRLFPSLCEKQMNKERSELHEKVKEIERTINELEKDRIIKYQQKVIETLRRPPPTKRIGFGLRVGPKIWFDIGRRRIDVD